MTPRMMSTARRLAELVATDSQRSHGIATRWLFSGQHENIFPALPELSRDEKACIAGASDVACRRGLQEHVIRYLASIFPLLPG